MVACGPSLLRVVGWGRAREVHGEGQTRDCVHISCPVWGLSLGLPVWSLLVRLCLSAVLGVVDSRGHHQAAKSNFLDNFSQAIKEDFLRLGIFKYKRLLITIVHNSFLALMFVITFRVIEYFS